MSRNVPAVLIMSNFVLAIQHLRIEIFWLVWELLREWRCRHSWWIRNKQVNFSYSKVCDTPLLSRCSVRVSWARDEKGESQQCVSDAMHFQNQFPILESPGLINPTFCFPSSPSLILSPTSLPLPHGSLSAIFLNFLSLPLRPNSHLPFLPPIAALLLTVK